MASKVVWSYAATSDLEAIADYIARDSSFYADVFVREILLASRSLSEFSERGRIVPELGKQSIRELLVREYRLVYTVKESDVVILGLIHGKRDLKMLWEKEKRG